MKTCESCGNPIDEERLEVFPNTRFCVKCTDISSPRKMLDVDALVAKPCLDARNGFAGKS